MSTTGTAETAEEQRARILAAAPDTHGWEYDLAVDLGYEPERWDGMWKLAMHPFSVRFGHVVAREVVRVTENGAETRLKVYPLPDGWQFVADYRLTQKEPTYAFASPRDRAWLRERFPWMNA